MCIPYCERSAQNVPRQEKISFLLVPSQKKEARIVCKQARNEVWSTQNVWVLLFSIVLQTHEPCPESVTWYGWFARLRTSPHTSSTRASTRASWKSSWITRHELRGLGANVLVTSRWVIISDVTFVSRLRTHTRARAHARARGRNNSIHSA